MSLKSLRRLRPAYEVHLQVRTEPDYEHNRTKVHTSLHIEKVYVTGWELLLNKFRRKKNRRRLSKS